MNKKQINLYDKFSSFVILRKDIRELKKQILKKKLNLVVFNFDNIKLISRSAAHEFILVKEELKNNGLDVSFEKMCPDVEKMFTIVLNSKDNKKTKIKLKYVPIKELIKDFKS